MEKASYRVACPQLRSFRYLCVGGGEGLWYLFDRHLVISISLLVRFQLYQSDLNLHSLFDTLSPLALQSQASMSPHQAMFLVFYDVLGLEIACWQIFSHAEIFLIRKKVSLQLFDIFKRNRAFIF